MFVVGFPLLSFRLQMGKPTPPPPLALKITRYLVLIAQKLWKIGCQNIWPPKNPFFWTIHEGYPEIFWIQFFFKIIRGQAPPPPIWIGRPWPPRKFWESKPPLRVEWEGGGNSVICGRPHCKLQYFNLRCDRPHFAPIPPLPQKNSIHTFPPPDISEGNWEGGRKIVRDTLVRRFSNNLLVFCVI